MGLVISEVPRRKEEPFAPRDAEIEEDPNNVKHCLPAGRQEARDRYLKGSSNRNAADKGAEQKRLATAKATAAFHRLVFVLALLLPTIAVVAVEGAGAMVQFAAWARATAKHFSTYTRDPTWVSAALALSLERVCYTIFWMAPACVTRTCWFLSRGIGGTWILSPLDLVVTTFCVNKVIQVASFFALWWQACGPTITLADGESESDTTGSVSTTTLRFEPLTPLQLTLGVQLVIFGQILNLAVYHAIGQDGVYYGCRYGRPVTWCTGEVRLPRPSQACGSHDGLGR